jgi:hypothetical protein
VKNYEQTLAACFVCKKEIADNGWFCRLPRKTGDAAGAQATEILLCTPGCAFRHFTNLENETTTHHFNNQGK